MIEPNNSNININALMQQVNEKVAKQTKYTY
jgi:hypothetical protein